MSFRLCLNTSTIKPQPILEKIRLTAEAGFDGVELWINDVYEFVGQGGEVSQIERALTDYGLFVPSMIAMRQWAEQEGREYELALEECKRRMELAQRLGATYIVATPPREPCDFGQIAAHYKDLLVMGREIGITPIFEYISFFNSTSSLTHAWDIVQQADDPDACIILDAFHSWNTNSTLEELKQIPGDKIGHYHIDDAHPDMPATTQTDPNRVMIGDGPIDLAAEIQVLREIGYEGSISLELFNAELWEKDPAEVLRTGIERLRQLAS
jgi:2-keto-myo-inositol isomerase